MILRFLLIIIIAANSISVSFSQEHLTLSSDQASDLAGLAMSCIQKEYPNKPGEVLADSTDVRTPYEMHPAFYGCFDWHSSVHGHWMLVKLLKEFPDMSTSDVIRESLLENITKENIQKEIDFFYSPYNKNFERTYGWAWLLKLSMELRSWKDPTGKILADNLQPLADSIAQKYLEFLPKLKYPIRVGEHTNTAFGLSFAWDYSVYTNNMDLKNLIEEKAIEFYYSDIQCPLNWEPGGFDFLSPCLMEADLMTRVLSKEDLSKWITNFLPGILDNNEYKIEPGIVTDRSDGKLVHIDGLNFSRAWCLYHIAQATETNTDRLFWIANQHFNKSFSSISSGSYMGEHWLASFAVYAYFSR